MSIAPKESGLFDRDQWFWRKACLEINQFGRYQRSLHVAAAADLPETGGLTMAEINRLSVGKVLDKLRSNDEQKKTKDIKRDEKLEAMEEELRRLRKPGRRDGG